jgi:hypothetical protein
VITETLRRLLKREPKVEIDFASTRGAAEMPMSLFPPEANEIREINKSVIVNVQQILTKFDLSLCDAELRQRIATCNYRLYLTTSSQVPLNQLHAIEFILRRALQKSCAIDLSEVYWRYQDKKA